MSKGSIRGKRHDHRARRTTGRRRFLGCHVNRRALIVTDAVLAGLFWVVGVVNLLLGQPAGVLGAISALIVGTAAAITACIFIVSGGWQNERRQGRTKASR